MFRLIYRQRRRILFSGFLITLTVTTLAFDILRYQLADGPLWIAVASFALVASTVFVATAAIIAVTLILLPGWRFFWEQFTVFFLLSSALRAAVPALSDWPIPAFLLQISLLLAVFSLFYGSALDRFRLWVDHKETRRFRSAKSAEELWAQLLPEAEAIDRHWDPLLYSMTPVEDEDDAFEVEYQLGHSVYEHQTITFLEKDYPHRFRYHHLGEIDPKNRALVEGTFEVTIDPDDKTSGSIVTISAHRNAMLPRLGLLLWFDDELGSRTDFFRAKETGRRDWSTAGMVRREILALA